MPGPCPGGGAVRRGPSERAQHMGRGMGRPARRPGAWARHINIYIYIYQYIYIYIYQYIYIYIYIYIYLYI